MLQSTHKKAVLVKYYCSGKIQCLSQYWISLWLLHHDLVSWLSFVVWKHPWRSWKRRPRLRMISWFLRWLWIKNTVETTRSLYTATANQGSSSRFPEILQTKQLSNCKLRRLRMRRSFSLVSFDVGIIQYWCQTLSNPHVDLWNPPCQIRQSTFCGRWKQQSLFWGYNS